MIHTTGLVTVSGTPVERKDTSIPAPSPCIVRKAKQWELIKAHADSGLSVSEIAKKMKIDESVIANAARNHGFSLCDDSGKRISGAVAHKRSKEQKAESPKLKPVKEVLEKGAAAIVRPEKKARDAIVYADDAQGAADENAETKVTSEYAPMSWDKIKPMLDAGKSTKEIADVFGRTAKAVRDMAYRRGYRMQWKQSR